MAWEKEKMREYMRDRYRRVHGVESSKFRKTKEEAQRAEEEAVAKFKTVEEYIQHKKKVHRESRPKIPRIECSVCKVEYCDTEGRRQQHENTVKHKIAVATLQAHGVI